jgi:hypothetical protein
MNESGLRLAARLYGLLLRLYPRRFRAEFAEEMLAVFTATVTEAAGWQTLARVCWREWRDAPVAIIRAHWRERSRSMETQTMERVSGWGALAALVVFLFTAMAGIIEGRPWGDAATPLLTIGVGLLGAVIVLLILGAIKGLPVWSLPAAGLFLVLIAYFLIIPQGPSPFADWLPPTLSRFFRWWYAYRPVHPLLEAGQIWLTLLTLLGLIVLTAAALPPLRPFYERLRRDWTLLSFAVYGAALFGLYFTFDEYRREEFYLVASVVLLAAGAWVYLRSDGLQRRALALFAALTLAMATAALGKWLIVPIQEWPAGSGLHPPESSRWPETLPTVVMWGWLMIVMAAPALLMLLPRPPQTSERDRPQSQLR